MKSAFAFPPRLLLPIMVVLALFIVGVRVGDVWQTISEGKLFSPVATVQAEEAKPEEKHTEEKKTEAEKPAAKEAAKAETKADAPSAPATRKEEQSPEGDLYKMLMGRREQLDKRAAELDSREALIKVAETRVDQKIKEMETLRTQLLTLLGQASAAQAAQIENLVKIYETMKPKEAARIFETLDMPVLLGVIQKMKPARTAALLAEMNPQKAKDITTELTRQDQLPKVK